MSPRPSKLRRELYALVIIKLLVITGLWWAFVRDVKVEVDGERIAAHLVTPVISLSPLRHPGETHAQ